MKDQLITKFRFMVNLVLFFFLLFIYPLLVYAQDSSKERRGMVKGQTKEQVEIKYTASEFRDPFSPQVFIYQEEDDSKMQQFEETVMPRISELFSFSIQGIIWNPDNPLVIINNQVLKKGDDLLVSEGKNGDQKVTIKDIEVDGVTIVYLGEKEKFPYSVGLGLDKTKEE